MKQWTYLISCSSILHISLSKFLCIQILFSQISTFLPLKKLKIMNSPFTFYPAHCIIILISLSINNFFKVSEGGTKWRRIERDEKNSTLEGKKELKIHFVQNEYNSKRDTEKCRFFWKVLEKGNNDHNNSCQSLRTHRTSGRHHAECLAYSHTGVTWKLINNIIHEGWPCFFLTVAVETEENNRLFLFSQRP